MEIQRLTIAQVKNIYRKYIPTDFPPEETKPLRMITKGMAHGIYACYGLFREDALLGYAFFVRHDRDYLLDYFATVPEMRSMGYGSTFLRLLSAHLMDSDSILAEVENPDESGLTDTEQEQRTRRLNFYLRNDFLPTQVCAHTFGVDYLLIELPCRRTHTGEEISQIYRKHYRAMLPRFLYQKMIRVYLP